MLVLDFAQIQWRGHCMDEDTNEYIAQCCTQIGMIMEDASILALELGGLPVVDRGQRFAQLKQACEEITNLLDAARSAQSN